MERNDSIMDYINKDFEGLFLNVFPIPENADLFKEFPILTKYEEFKLNLPGANNNKLIRYVIFAFDSKSPLNSITDLIERRVEALKLAKINPGKKGYSKTIDEAVHGGNAKVNNMIIRYCLLTQDADYSVMVTYEDALYKELQRLANFEEDDDMNEKKGNIIKNINELRKSINELKSNILSNNVDYFLSRSLSDFAEAKRLDLSPEFYALKLKGWDNVSRYYV